MALFDFLKGKKDKAEEKVEQAVFIFPVDYAHLVHLHSSLYRMPAQMAMV